MIPNSDIDYISNRGEPPAHPAQHNPLADEAVRAYATPSFGAMIRTPQWGEAVKGMGAWGRTYKEMFDSIQEDETTFDIFKFGGKFNLGMDQYTGKSIIKKFDQRWRYNASGSLRPWGGYMGKATSGSTPYTTKLQGMIDDTLGRIESVYGAQQALSYQQDVHHQGLGAFTRQGVGPEQAPGVNTAQQLAVRGR